MRPTSMILFDRLYVAAIVLGIISGALNWRMTMTLLVANPALAAMGLNVVYAFFIASMIVGLAFSLLFWYFVSRRASNVARWIWAVLVVIGIPGSLSTAFGATGTLVLPGLGRAVIVISVMLNLDAVVMLFRPDSRAWFARRGAAVDPGVFT